MSDESAPRYVFSYGGGVQSNAVMVLAEQGKIRVDAFVFANVGDDSENPETLAYIENHAKPYMEAHGMRYIEVRRKGPSLYQVAADPKRRSVCIPARRRAEGGSDGRAHRNCTTDWKIVPVDRWIVGNYAGQHVKLGLGISVDEFQRARSTAWNDRDDVSKRKLGFWRSRWYPLLDLRLNRVQCAELILSAGLPLPPKSSCFFCPFRRKPEWVTLRAENPELFERAAKLEDALNAKGLEGVYRLHGTPNWFSLREWVSSNITLPLFGDDEDGCADGGWCHT